MAMEVHNTPKRDMDHFIRECGYLFHDRQSRGHLSLSFYILFFMQHVSIILQCVLSFAIKKKIALGGNACFKLLLLELTICMLATLEGLWVR
jgi:uncharacterized membrane protein YwaF